MKAEPSGSREGDTFRRNLTSIKHVIKIKRFASIEADGDSAVHDDGTEAMAWEDAGIREADTSYKLRVDLTRGEA